MLTGALRGSSRDEHDARDKLQLQPHERSWGREPVKIRRRPTTHRPDQS